MIARGGWETVTGLLWDVRRRLGRTAGLLLLACAAAAPSGEAATSSLSFDGTSSFYHAPYLLDFDFTLRDEATRSVVVDPTSIQVSCREDGVPISPTESQYRLLTAKNRQLRSVLVLDYTLSMTDPITNGDLDRNGRSDAQDRMEAAAKLFIGSVDREALVGLFEFHREDQAPSRVLPFTRDRASLSNHVDQIWRDFVRGFPSATRCWDAVYAAVAEFSEANPSKERRCVVFLSDGRDESSVRRPAEVIQLARRLGVRVYPVGYGRELQPTDLQAIAVQTDGRYYAAPTASELLQAFSRIVEDLRGQYVLRWATLKRSATPFVPSFALTLGGRTGVYASAPVYVPTQNTGDVLVGSVLVDSNRDENGILSITLRADYVPRFVTRIRVDYAAVANPTIRRIPIAEGGICPDNWVLENRPDLGWLEFRSPDPNSIFTAIPFASLGGLCVFEFANRTNANRVFTRLAIDDSIYSNGQRFRMPNGTSVLLTSQTIAFEPIADRYLHESPFSLDATASSGLPVTFRVLSGPARVEDAQVTLTGTGLVTIRAEQAGSESIAPAFLDRSFVVKARLPQTLDFEPLRDRYQSESGFKVSATASSSLPVVFKIVSGPAWIEGDLVALTAPGTVTIRAEQAGDMKYEPVVVDRAFTVKPQEEQVIQVTPLTAPRPGEVFTLTILSSSGLPLDVRVSQGPARYRRMISANEFEFEALAAGSVILGVLVQGNVRYLPLATTILVGIARSLNPVDLVPLRDRSLAESPFWVAASAASTLPVELEVAAGPAEVHGNVVRLVAPGTVTLRARARETAYFDAGVAERTFQVLPAPEHATPIEWLRLQGYTNDFGKAELEDPDADGAALWEEYRAGTAPRNAASILRLTAERVGVGAFRLRFPTESNQLYAVEFSDGLALWQSVVTRLAGTGGIAEFADPAAGSAPAFRAYRVHTYRPDGMIWVPPGSFLMGSSDADRDRYVDRETPQRRVTVSRGFWLGQWEVTQEEFFSVLGGNPAQDQGDPRIPVETVSWDTAMSFCAERTARERRTGRLPPGFRYRLPTEAEWEYACRAGTTTRFSYGDDPDYSQLGAYAWTSRNSGLRHTQAVGSKQPNRWGFYDMHGGLREWCLDWFANYPGGEAVDPIGPATGTLRVVRNGDFLSPLRECRSASRNGLEPGRSGQNIGFRVALAAEP